MATANSEMRLLLAVVATLCVVAPASSAEANSILDPSFEEPAATSKWKSADSASRLTTEHKRSGAQSLMLRNDGKGVKGTALHNAGQAGIPVASVTAGAANTCSRSS